MHAPRRIVIVTTAAPPWYTGTSLNPIQRARALGRRGLTVGLIFPWLEPGDQAAVFPPELRFVDQAAHAEWLRARFDCEGVGIDFYPAYYDRGWRSVYPRGALAPALPAEGDLILEEPEHLFFLQPFSFLRRRGGRVLGIIHTNYMYYAEALLGGWRFFLARPFLAFYFRFLVKSNCHRALRLSAAVDIYRDLPAENVNGVDPRFFAVPPPAADAGLYFVGKVIWEKGFRELITLLCANGVPALDVYGLGDGRSEGEIVAFARARGLRLNLRGYCAEPWRALADYKIFVNCSRSEVLCTTTAEALAMGKFAIVPRHPSNAFFAAHPNCLIYDSPEGFAACLARARAEVPRPAAADALSWDAAAERLLRFVEG